MKAPFADPRGFPADGRQQRITSYILTSEGP